MQLHNNEIEEVENLTFEEHKLVTKEESQQAFEKLQNRFQNSFHFEDKHIDLLNQVKEALSEINKDEKQQTKIDPYFKKNE